MLAQHIKSMLWFYVDSRILKDTSIDRDHLLHCVDWEWELTS